MSDTRPVWLTQDDATRLFQIAIDLENYGGLLGNADPGFVRSIAHAVRDAPADATEAVSKALGDCEYRITGMGGEPEPLHELYQPEGCRIIRAAAVLAALGHPKPRGAR